MSWPPSRRTLASNSRELNADRTARSRCSCALGSPLLCPTSLTVLPFCFLALRPSGAAGQNRSLALTLQAIER